MIKVSHFGHTSKGSKSSFPAYCIYCVTQIAADQIGAGWRIFCWGGLAHALSWGFGLLPTDQTPKSRSVSCKSVMKSDPSVKPSPSLTPMQSPRNIDKNRSAKILVQQTVCS